MTLATKIERFRRARRLRGVLHRLRLRYYHWQDAGEAKFCQYENLIHRIERTLKKLRDADDK